MEEKDEGEGEGEAEVGGVEEGGFCFGSGYCQYTSTI